MSDDVQWQKTELAARQANGRGQTELASQLMVQAVEEARQETLEWSQLKSALTSAALFHDFIVEDYQLALVYYREAQQILIQHIGSDAREAVNFASWISDCEAKANSAVE